MALLLASRLLRSTIAVDGGAILSSTSSLVLAPLGAGVLTAALFPRVAQRLRPFCAPAGIISTSLLVAGGAAAAYGCSSWRAHVGVVAMPLVAAALALALSKLSGLRGAAPGRRRGAPP